METLTSSTLLQHMAEVKSFLPEMLMNDIPEAWSLYRFIQSNTELKEAFKNA